MIITMMVTVVPRAAASKVDGTALLRRQVFARQLAAMASARAVKPAMMEMSSRAMVARQLVRLNPDIIAITLLQMFVPPVVAMESRQARNNATTETQTTRITV